MKHLWIVLIASACGAPLAVGDSYDNSPAYSPDGTRIAFGSSRRGNGDVYIIHADGTGETRITFEDGNEEQPTWSPDGTKLAICSDRDGNREIYLIDPDGSNPVNLTNHPADDCDSGWSPDGTKILFKSTRGGDWRNHPDDNHELYLMNADGSDPKRLTHTPGYDLSTGQAWSPDGSEIVFCSSMDKKFVRGPNQFDDFDLYIMKADGSDIRQLTFTEGQDSYAYWSPDGRTISYTHVEKNAPREEISGGQNYEIGAYVLPGLIEMHVRLR